MGEHAIGRYELATLDKVFNLDCEALLAQLDETWLAR
jgi:hypothetical protein